MVRRHLNRPFDFLFLVAAKGGLYNVRTFVKVRILIVINGNII